MTITKVSNKKKLLLAITGASGMLFVTSFLEEIAEQGHVIHGICSTSGKKVLEMEQSLCPNDLPGVSHWFDCHDLTAPPASGSSDYTAMIVLPCSMGTLAAISGGLSLNLIHRAADVTLKERRLLILAVRETPLNRTHLKNMLDAHDAGAVICPPFPSFYLKPETLQEAAKTYSWRLADQLGITINNRKRWTDQLEL